MNFHKEASEVFICGRDKESDALSQVTDLCIAAHHDDIEIMAYGAIAACFDDPLREFGGVVVNDGAGSPRSGIYGTYTDEEMKAVRILEQKNASMIGKYAAQIFLGFESREIKNPADKRTVDDLEKIILATAPKTLYTHNLADKHDTHVAVALRVIEALRRLPKDKRPEKVYAMEVWRGLDWLCDEDKAVFDTSPHPNLAAALLGVYDSQIAGGKRYDDAAIGRRQANATFFASHATDESNSISFGVDITDLIDDSSLSPADFIASLINSFAKDVENRITTLS